MQLFFTLGSLLCISLFSYSSALAQEAKPGELIVKLKTDLQAKSGSAFSSLASDLSTSLGNKVQVKVKTLLTTSQYAVLKSVGPDLKSAIAILQKDPRVAYAEPNYIYRMIGDAQSEVIPNDPSFSQLWGLKNTGQADPGATPGQPGKVGSDIHVTQAWAEGVTGSKTIRVAVIDTGIDYTHPDLKDNVDQASGFNFVTNTANAIDDQNHGSHCSGTIGAAANNGQGVAGINWNVTLIPVKFLDASGSGTADGALQAIQYATKIGVNIMSNSWGGGAFSQALLDAINDAKAKGILFVAAAGNAASDNDSKPSYPASYDADNIISVAASDNQDKLASFSNFGKTTVHLAAPGVDILSTIVGGKYEIMSGTSMATPHVSGMAALLWSTNPSLTYAQVKNTLIRSCDKVRGLTRRVACGGRANIYNAIHGIFPVETGPAESAWKDVAMSIQTPHPYVQSTTYTYPISVPNAKYIRVIFDSLDTESGYDLVHIHQANGDEIETLSGTLSGYVSDYLEGDHAEISLISDSSINKTGFVVTKVQAIY